MRWFISISTLKTAKFSLSIRIGLRQVKRQSSNPKSERYFWLNPDFIEGNLKHKKRRTNSCESILRLRDLGRIQTCNLLSRNQVLYSVELRGPFCWVQIYRFLKSLQIKPAKNLRRFWLCRTATQ